MAHSSGPDNTRIATSAHGEPVVIDCDDCPVVLMRGPRGVVLRPISSTSNVE